MDQFASAHQRRRGRESPSSSVVERTLVAILEQVCEEADAAEAGERSPERPRGGRFTILLDLTRCSRAHVPAFVTFGKILRNARDKNKWRKIVENRRRYAFGPRGQVLTSKPPLID